MDPTRQSSFGIPSGYADADTSTNNYTQFAGNPRQEATNPTGIKVQLAISIALGLVAFLTFCLLRTRWIVMFAPRTKLRRHTPPILSSTFFGWIPQLLRIPEAEVLDCVGLDAVMLLRFFHMAIRLFALFMVPGLLIVFPVNWLYAPKEKRGSHEDALDYSVLGVFRGDDQKTPFIYLITHFTFTWVFSILTLYTLWKTYEDYVTIRRSFMLKRARSITNRSVMITGLPLHLQSDRSLAIFYESLGVGTVESAHVCRHVGKLQKLVEQRANALQDLERAYANYYGNPSEFPGYDPEAIEEENNRLEESDQNQTHSAGSAPASQPQPTSTTAPGANSLTSISSSAPAMPVQGAKAKARPTTRLGFLGLFGQKVDKIDHLRQVFFTLDKAVQKMRLSKIYTMTSTGFVTFENMHAAQILAQTVNTQETLSCYTMTAPEPRDIFWDNASLPPSELTVRSIVINVTLFFLVLFAAGPLTLLSGFLNLDSLEHFFPFLYRIAAIHPILRDLIQGFLPTLGVVIFLALVPKILEGMCESQGIQSYSGIARSIFHKYFIFQIFNVVLIFTIAGTLWQTVNKVYHDLSELARILAESLPKVAPFFVNFTILKGIGLFPVQMLQIGEVFQQTFKHLFAKTPRDYAESRAPPDLKYGVVYANTLLVFIIILIYSTIKPIILIFGVVYFTFGYVALKYELLYVFFHPNESGGLAWPMVYNRVVVGLLIFQLTMVGLFIVNKSFYLAALLAPLVVCTIWWWWWTNKSYRVTAQYVPLELLRSTIVEYEVDSSVSNGDTIDYGEGVSIVGARSPGHSCSGTSNGHHVVLNIESASNNGNGNSKSNSTPKAVLPSTTPGNAVKQGDLIATPQGTRRRVIKSMIDDDDYQALPDRYTDYRQPPMTLFPGVLNSGRRQFCHPALSGPLPTLWLPLRKDDGDSADKKKKKKKNTLGNHDDSEESDHDLEDHLARPPLMLPTKGSDEPRTFDEGDNLVGGGQDEDLSNPHLPEAPAAITKTPAASTQPQQAGKDTVTTVTSRGIEVIPKPAAPSPGEHSNDHVVAGSSAAGAVASDAASEASEGDEYEAVRDGETTEDGKPRNPAVEGIQDIYYHHPERRLSNASSRPRTASLMGQGSRASLLSTTSSTARPPASAPAAHPSR
ncbi:hypothetical protein DFQ26_006588 [Actinomortierella ambigua]|nr:hypothetical protein DFQ26_006588 [Actinomortierella ambigua]